MSNSDGTRSDASRTDATRTDATHRKRVLVVDDSAFMRRLIRELITESGEFEVVGAARDGDDAIRQVHALDPDIVTLDVEMPGLDGLEVLGYIMSEVPRAVVMLSAGGADAGVSATLRALELGAVDFVRKPSGPISLDLGRVGDRLLDALRAAATMHVERVHVLARPPRAVPAHARARDVPATRAVLIAASTGGPAALTQVVPRFSCPLGAAVLIVQHMPKGFTASLAQRLDGLSALTVVEARDGDLVRADVAYVAPGGQHMRVLHTVDGPRLTLEHGPTVWGVRPAADPLFTSAVNVFGNQLVGVVLTGMGRDGAEGLRLVRAAGGHAVVQDPELSVIPGMPNAALRHAGADRTAAIGDVAAAVHEGLSALPSASRAERVNGSVA